MKYLNAEVTFAEVPDEISLCINITGCDIHCPDCHSKFLWEETGTDMTIEELDRLVAKNPGITCICFMGGHYKEVEMFAAYAKGRYHKEKIKTAWYTGLSDIPEDMNLFYLDYVKVGPYIAEKGGLDNPNTNQVMLEITHIDGTNIAKDITVRFQHDR